MGAYNLVQVTEGDEHKLAFWTRYGLFEPTVLQFRATNAPADFQGYIHNAMGESSHDFASADLGDVLIYSDSEEEHVGYMKWIMQW